MERGRGEQRGRDVGSSDGELAALVVRARDGDGQAFAALHARYAPMVHGLLVCRVPPGEVDDLLQEVFLAAWRGLGGLRREEHVGAWLASIARRAAARHHARARPAPEPLPAGLADGRPPAPDPDLGRLVLDELAALPEAYQETLALRLVEGLGGPQIAALTGLTHGSVRVNLSRGLDLLRERLQRSGWP